MRDRILMWRYRTLTQYGKIQVINMLIASQAAYRFMCLPSPQEKSFDDYKTMVREFLWGEKTPPKTNYNKSLQDYEVGLKLIDLEAKDLSLKAGWANKAMSAMIEPEVSPLYYRLPIQSPIIWKVNYSREQMQTFALDNGVTKVYSLQVWAAWSQLVFHMSQGLADIKDQTLWYNYKITRAKTPWFIPEAMEVGVNKITQIYDFPTDTFIISYLN